MKVEALSLMFVASLAVAAAIPIGSGAPPSSMDREERARKDSAKLRLLETALAHGRSDKERRAEIAHLKSQEPSESKVVVSKAETTRSAPKAAPATTTAADTTTTTSATPKADFTLRLERQRSVADQALRERLMRHTGPQKDEQQQRGGTLARNSPPAAATKAPPQQGELQKGAFPTVPPVVYVPLSDERPEKGPQPLRFAPYVPAALVGQNNRASSPWPFASYFPLLINDPYQAIVGSGPLFEYGEEADVCRPKKKGPAREAGAEGEAAGPTEIAMQASGYVTRVVVRGGGVAIAGPGGVATAGRGGTAIVGPGGVAYTRPGALAVVGPGGKVLSQRNQGPYASHGDSDLRGGDRQEGVLVARGPVIYYDDFEERK